MVVQNKKHSIPIIKHGVLAGAPLHPATSPWTFPTNYAPARADSVVKSCSKLEATLPQQQTSLPHVRPAGHRTIRARTSQARDNRWYTPDRGKDPRDFRSRSPETTQRRDRGGLCLHPPGPPGGIPPSNIRRWNTCCQTCHGPCAPRNGLYDAYDPRSWPGQRRSRPVLTWSIYSDSSCRPKNCGTKKGYGSHKTAADMHEYSKRTFSPVCDQRYMQQSKRNYLQ